VSVGRPGRPVLRRLHGEPAGREPDPDGLIDPRRAESTSGALLGVEAVTAGYGRRIVVRNVSLSVGPGECMVIVGPNGAGKTTLLRTIAGTLRLRGGQIMLRGKDIGRTTTRSRAEAGLAFVPDRDIVFASMTVMDNLRIALDAVGRRFSAETTDHVFELFPILRERARQRAGTLSGGQRRMLAIARAMIVEPALMVLDEPSAGLSVAAQVDVAERLRQLHGAGIATLIAEQNLQFASSVGQAALLLDRGTMRWRGDAGSLLTASAVEEAIVGRGIRRAADLRSIPDGEADDDS
jgi:ABC-type branched-subunit amino acid transport system ATPase component